MFARLYNILFLVGLAMGLGSCVSDDAGTRPEPVRVLLVYVGADNNLCQFEQAKLQALREGWTGKTTDRIIVYRDSYGSPAQLIELSNLAAGQQPREIATYGPDNSASPRTLGRVIDDVVGMCRADSYGLLVFSHASGWLPEGIYAGFAKGSIPAGALSYSDRAESTAESTAGSSRSVIIDGTSEMELRDFAAAIPDGVFDYIVFEACFMAGIEVAYELRSKAPLILASSAEIVDPGFAPSYSSATDRLLAANLAGFGRSVFDHTLTYAETNPQRSATYSVICTAGLDALAAFIRDNCDLTREVDLAAIQRFDRLKAATLFFDLEDYYGRLLDTDAQRSQLARLVADCIGWKAATNTFMTQHESYNGFAITKHSGLTAYIAQAKYPGLNDAYSALGWADAVSFPAAGGR